MCCILCDEPVRSISVGLAASAIVAVVKAVRRKSTSDSSHDLRAGTQQEVDPEGAAPAESVS